MEALFLMCPQNSYFHPSGSVYMGEKAEVLKIRLFDYLARYGGMKIFFREKHVVADGFFVNDKTHSVVNTFDFLVLDEFKRYASVYYDKNRYSGFFDTGLDALVKKEKISSVVLMGVETHTSVLFTAEELRNRSIDVSVIEPLTASRDDFMHSTAISVMNNFLGVRING